MADPRTTHTYRLDPRLSTAIAEAATEAGLSANALVEALLAGRFGIPHPHAATANTATRQWKAGRA